jgi:hypothetical protein
MSEQEESFDHVPTVIHSKRERDSQPIKKPKRNKLSDDIEKIEPKKKELGLLMAQIRKANKSKTALTSEKSLPPLGPDQPHDSAYVHSALKEKHTLGVLPTLNTDEKGNAAAYILIGLLALTFLAGWGVAYEAQIAITPHASGVCAAPAVIEKGGCFTVQSSTNANGATVTTLVPAGHLTK